MNDLSPPARRYILELMVMGALVSLWELSHLQGRSLGLFLILLLHIIGAYVLRKGNPSDTAKSAASFALLAIGLALIAWQLPQLPEPNAWILLALGILAAFTHISKQLGPTARSSYQTSFVVYGFTLTLLGAPATIMTILIAHVLEYAWGDHYPWYIQCFNVAMFTIATSAAGLIIRLADANQQQLGNLGVFGLVLALAVFVLINHVLTGLVLKTARGQSFKESGVFGYLTLMIDFTLLCTGFIATLLWQINPYAIFLVAMPLVLFRMTLRVPALERQAETDTKTGLYNAGYFADSIQQELARAHRFGRPLTLVMGDLDLLREINNTHGHLAGDAVLIGIAKTLSGMARDYDVVARFGGEEFAILMPETTPESAKPLIESMRQAIADATYQATSQGTPIKATMSFGISSREHSGESVKDLIQKADQALYKAKENGRNQVVVFAQASQNGAGSMQPLPGKIDPVRSGGIRHRVASADSPLS